MAICETIIEDQTTDFSPIIVTKEFISPGDDTIEIVPIFSELFVLEPGEHYHNKFLFLIGEINGITRSFGLAASSTSFIILYINGIREFNFIFDDGIITLDEPPLAGDIVWAHEITSGGYDIL